MWECLCSCGETKLFTGTNLRTENTTSCGCLHKERLAENNRQRLTEAPWVADMSHYIRRLGYRKNRKPMQGLGSNQFVLREGVSHNDHPSLNWALTLDEYKALVTSPCCYCGVPPAQTPYGVNMIGLKRNGIDRVDNNKGYEPSNCVPCCLVCNREKRAQSVAVFIENTRRRYFHLVSKGLITK